MGKSINSRILFILSIVVLTFMASSCSSIIQENAYEAHSVLIYNYAGQENSDEVLRVWTYQRVEIDSRYEYAKVKVIEGRTYILEDGTSVLFRHGEILVSGSNFGKLSGNYVLSDGSLNYGFIRTFD